MKKSVSVFLILTILMVCIIGNVVHVYAESFESKTFTIRDGVTFSSTKQDVMAIEGSKNNLTLLEEKRDFLDYKGTVAGYENNSRVRYNFRNTVISIEYCLEPSLARGDGIYSTVKQDLTNKYGTPDTVDNIDSYPLFLHNTGLEYSRFQEYLLNTQWFIKFNDCDVVITLWTEPGYFGGTVCNLRYDLYSHSEMDTLLSESNKQKNSDF